MDLITIAAIAIALYNLILILVVIAWCCFILGCKPYRDNHRGVSLVETVEKSEHRHHKAITVDVHEV